MVTVLKTDSGTQIISANLQKTIYSIKEIVGNHSDSEIFNALKETNMDPNEAAQKLLNQDPFHEVRRRRDKKKEDEGHNSYVEPRKRTEYMSQSAKFYGSDRNVRRGSYSRIPVQDAGVSRQFRVVRDNRVNRNSDRETKVSAEVSSSVNVQRINNSFEKSSSVSANNQRHSGRYVQSLNGGTEFQPKMAQNMNLNIRKEHVEERKSIVPVSASQVPIVKPSDSKSQSGSNQSSNAVGVYASASDPVHVPSPDSRSSAAVGAIRREVGVVGGRQQSSESTSKQSFQHTISNLKPVLGSSSTTDSLRSINNVSRNDQSHSTVADSVMANSAGTRFANHSNGRLHHQPVAHQKGVFLSKEWKPKTSQKSHAPSPGVIGSPVKSASKPSDGSKIVVRKANQLEEKLSQVNIHESENVIIAQHIRVPESDRCRLTFGSFGVESGDAENSASGFQEPECVEEESQEHSPSKQISPVDNQVQNSGSSSPSITESESQLPEKQDSPGVSNTENYTDMALSSNSSSFTASKSQQQESVGLPNLSAYESQQVYDIPYFRPSIDDAVRGPGLPSPQEVLPSHMANSIPPSSMAMMQQQQAAMAQMYPQVHLSHYANVMPYRQFIPPMYVPPTMVPGYSGNPGYPHLSNGSSYVLMPGGTSHLSPNNLKYGVQQFKPLPGGSPTGFGNFPSPTGYAINAPGVVGGPTGIDDSSRLKYKDNNLYVPNPQVETSDVWMQNQRELAGMQSGPYFNMQGHTAHPHAHPASPYLQSHTSYNGVPQSSHMQFPGMYPPQPSAHHMGGSNIGVGVAPQAAPGPQVGPYHQQPTQMGHLNWTTNF